VKIVIACNIVTRNYEHITHNGFRENEVNKLIRSSGRLDMLSKYVMFFGMVG
jgi:hypothetical protein